LNGRATNVDAGRGRRFMTGLLPSFVSWVASSRFTVPERSRSYRAEKTALGRRGRKAQVTDAHRKLDELVLSAYGWKPDISDDNLLAKLLELNLAGRSGLVPQESESQKMSAAAGASS
jgi:hypothetical protein